MMLDALVAGLDASTRVARLSHTTIHPDELVGLLAAELGVESREGGKLDRLRAVQDFLDDWTGSGRNAVLVVDEAQNLSPEVLEEIRLLSNLRSHGKCALQIVLAGQPEFRERLDLPELAQLKQRIGIRYHLTPLSAGETADYVRHRLAVAGSKGVTVFDEGAMSRIYDYSGGVPRKINVLCDRALVAGYAANKQRIGRSIVQETVGELEGASDVRDRRQAGSPPWGSVSEARSSRPARPVLMPVAVASAILLVAAGLFSLPSVREVIAHPYDAGFGVASASQSRPAEYPMRPDGPGQSLPGAEVELQSTDWSDVPAVADSGVQREPAPESEAEDESSVRPEAASDAQSQKPGASRDEVDASMEAASSMQSAPGESELFVPGYRVIALSGRNEDLALRAARELSLTGTPAQVVPVRIDGMGLWYRVAVNDVYPSLTDALDVVGTLHELGYEGAWAQKIR